MKDTCVRVHATSITMKDNTALSVQDIADTFEILSKIFFWLKFPLFVFTNIKLHCVVILFESQCNLNASIGIQPIVTYVYPNDSWEAIETNMATKCFYESMSDLNSKHQDTDLIYSPGIVIWRILKLHCS